MEAQNVRVTVTSTRAQVHGGSGEKVPVGDAVAVQLLRDNKILRELKCTLAQRESIEDAIEEVEEDLADMAQGMGPALIQQGLDVSLPNEPAIDPAEGAADSFSRIGELSTKTGRVLRSEVLTKEQARRLDQIELRLRGPRAFLLPGVVETLKLSDKQKTAVEEQIAATEKEIQERGAVQIGGPGGGITVFGTVRPQELASILENAVEEIIDALTPEQRKLWDQMVGPELKHQPKVSLFGGEGGLIGGGNMIFGDAVQTLPFLPVQPLPPQE